MEADYIKEIIARMSVEQITSFLLHGVEDTSGKRRPYKERLEAASNPIYKRLQEVCHDTQELDKAVADVMLLQAEYAEVFIELGMKAGARLLHQLLSSDDHVI